MNPQSRAQALHVRQPWLPYLAVAAVLVMTAVAVVHVVKTERTRARLRFEGYVGETAAAIESRMDTYVAVLRAGAGFYAGSDDVEKDEFRRFAARLDLKTRYPGIQGLGFTQRVAAAELARFVETARREIDPAFHVWPDTPRPEYHAIIYLEPLDRRNRAAIGYDMFTEPVRREAMTRARDTGSAATTGRVTLVQEIDERKQAGFLVYVPVYDGGDTPETVEDRRRLLEGFVYAPFRADDLMHGILGTARTEAVTLHLYASPAPDRDALLHVSDGTPFSTGPLPHEGGGGDELVRTVPIGVAGSTWCVTFAAAPGFSESGAAFPVGLALGGLAAGLLLFVLVRAQVRARAEAERTAFELARSEEALRQSQKMEAVGRLAGGVAHDFNNVLTAINGYSELLLSELAPDDPHRHYAEEIHRAGQRAAGFVGQLLAFGRKQVVESRVISVNDLVLEIEGMLRRLITENIRIETRLAPDLGQVRVDPSRLEQALVNLAVNARDAMPEGGVLAVETANVDLDEDDVRLRPGARPGPFVRLTVTDTGVGMSDEVLQHVFEPFFTTKGPGKGTGLGLATVYGAVRQAGGFVTVESAPGEGSSFALFLPRIDARVELPRGPVEPGNVPTGAESILLVEDEDNVRAFTAEVLKRAGYAVDSAATPEEARARWHERRGNVDLLVTDIVMPGGSGRELAAQLRAEVPELRVLFVSGYTQGELEHEALGPTTGFLAKPFTAQALAERVRELLNA